MKTFKNEPKLFQVEAKEKIKTHIDTEYFSHIEPKSLTTTVEPIENYINCKNTGEIMGYIDPVNIDEPVCTNSMYNKLG